MGTPPVVDIVAQSVIFDQGASYATQQRLLGHGAAMTPVEPCADVLVLVGVAVAA